MQWIQLRASFFNSQRILGWLPWPVGQLQLQFIFVFFFTTTSIYIASQRRVTCVRPQRQWRPPLAGTTTFPSLKWESFDNLVYCISDESSNIQELISNQIKLFPNPSSNILNIQSEYLPDSYNIISTLGQVLKTSEINSTSEFTIDIKELKEGLYFIKLNKDNSSQTLSFVKN